VLSDVWRKLLVMVEVHGVRKVVIQFVASHCCGVVRNELADVAADEACKRWYK
jgi:hypothetical protein